MHQLVPSIPEKSLLSPPATNYVWERVQRPQASKEDWLVKTCEDEMVILVFIFVCGLSFVPVRVSPM